MEVGDGEELNGQGDGEEDVWAVGEILMAK